MIKIRAVSTDFTPNLRTEGFRRLSGNSWLAYCEIHQLQFNLKIHSLWQGCHSKQKSSAQTRLTRCEISMKLRRGRAPALVFHRKQINTNGQWITSAGCKYVCSNVISLPLKSSCLTAFHRRHFCLLPKTDYLAVGIYDWPHMKRREGKQNSKTTLCFSFFVPHTVASVYTSECDNISMYVF